MMQAFKEIEGVAAPLFEHNIDTDQICPKQHLKRLERAGFADALFSNHRFDADGTVRADFILNQPPWQQARILVAGDNFACGSSREHAVWSLVDFGIRCVIAPSFGDIFFQNSVNSGLLAVCLPLDQVARLARLARETPAQRWRVDLPGQRIVPGDGEEIGFEIEPERKDRLLSGLDEIGMTLHRQDAITSFEMRQRSSEPWLWVPVRV